MGRIAGLLSLEVEDQNASVDALQHVGSELAMHVVAAKPLFLTKDDVSTEAMESEREILKSQVLFNAIKTPPFATERDPDKAIKAARLHKSLFNLFV